MVQTWKVSWNKDFYNYKGIIEDFKDNKLDVIKQSKGLAHMVNIPNIGDKVYVSCNTLKIISCEVISNFEINNDVHESDIYNIGFERRHTGNDTHLKMQILEVFDNPVRLIGNQRTWCKYIV